MTTLTPTNKLYPKTISAANLTTAQNAFSGVKPTEAQIHLMIAAAPGGNLEDLDWMDWITNKFQNNQFKGALPKGGGIV